MTRRENISPSICCVEFLPSHIALVNASLQGMHCAKLRLTDFAACGVMQTKIPQSSALPSSLDSSAHRSMGLGRCVKQSSVVQPQMRIPTDLTLCISQPTYITYDLWGLCPSFHILSERRTIRAIEDAIHLYSLPPQRASVECWVQGLEFTGCLYWFKA